MLPDNSLMIIYIYIYTYIYIYIYMGNSHCDGRDKLIDILTCKCPLRPKKEQQLHLLIFL